MYKIFNEKYFMGSYINNEEIFLKKNIKLLHILNKREGYF